MNDQGRQRAWFTLWVLFGVNLLNFYDRQILSAVNEPIRKEWVLSDTAMGTLNTAFILIYAAVGVPLGRLADSWSRSKILGLGVTVWSVLTAASGLAWNYAALFVSRLGVGVGEASCAPAANSLIGDLFPAAKRARAISFFMLGLPIGQFLSYRLSGMIAHAFGWRAAFLLACVPGLLLAPLALRIREPARGGAEDHPRASRPPEKSPFWLVLSIPTLLWLSVSGAFHNFNMYVLSSFLTAFLSRFHHLGLREANNVSSIVGGAVGVAGLLAGGWAADRLSSARPDGRLLFSSVALFVAAPLVYFALEMPAGAVLGFTVLMGAGSMLTYVYYSCVYAAIADVVTPALRGTAMAVYFFAMYVLGASLGPVGAGMLSDHFAKKAMAAAGAATMTEPFKAAGLHSAMYVIPIFCTLVGVLLLAASRTVAADSERMRRGFREPAFVSPGQAPAPVCASSQPT